MTADIVDLDIPTRLDIPAERVLRKALEAELDSVVIAGHTKDGDEYFAASLADGGDVLWLLERCKHRVVVDIPDELSC